MFALEHYVERDSSKRHHEGNVLWLEFGVFDGFSINVTSIIRDTFSKASDIEIVGFDWFNGLPTEWTSSDTQGKGAFDRQGRLPYVRENVTLIVGLFNQTLNSFLRDNRGLIEFANIDNDLYEGALYILQRIVPRMRRGSILHFHELLKWSGRGSGNCAAHDELRALYDVFDVIPGLHLELLAVRGPIFEPVLFRVLHL